MNGIIKLEFFKFTIGSPHQRKQLPKIVAFGSFFIALLLAMHSTSEIKKKKFLKIVWANGSQSVIQRPDSQSESLWGRKGDPSNYGLTFSQVILTHT